MTSFNSLFNKVAIITGAASGIGRATAKLFAENGAKLILCDSNARGMADLEEELRTKRTETVSVIGDVSESMAVLEIVRAVGQFGCTNILFNNAGIDLHASLEDTREADWDRIMNVNLKAVFLVSKAVIPFMSSDGTASIVNTSSAAGLYPINDRPAYIASKGAVIALTRAMALDLAPRSIRVNCICPGAVETPLLHGSMDAANLEAARAQPKR
jgi:NAD(P)-dependent dehydrogenase (short-subunit alcohol dehydrogenase family)